jgi:N-acetylglucosamine kinase-like BadF-type ATPase
VYLGVDGGGTKTAFAIIDADGHVLADHQESGAYYLDIGIDSLRKLIDCGVKATLKLAGLTINDIRFGFFGLPAYGEDSGLIAELDSIPSRVFTKGNYRCDNDMVCAWAGSLACQDGINLIAGTGSIGYGRYNGKASRCGGWGEVFSDEGSAYWIACRGLQLFSKMSDGRAVRGPLHDLVCREFNLAQDLDMSALVLHKWGAARARIADFARLMFVAARAGDDQVSRIFNDAADELAEIVNSIRRSLYFPPDVEVPVSWSGGVFKDGSFIIARLEQVLRESAAKYRLCQPKYSPVVGAALYAAVLDDFSPLKKKLAGIVL